jgi:hypothetical protein
VVSYSSHRRARELFDPLGANEKMSIQFLVVVCAIGISDLLAMVDGWSGLNYFSFPLDCIAVFLTVWMFIDLRRRQQKWRRSSWLMMIHVS